MPPLSPLLSDAAPRFQAPGPPIPIVYSLAPADQRQRVVNYVAKRLVDMVYVTGLDLATARRHFRRKPADTPGDLDDEADIAPHAAEVERAWSSNAITIEADDADRRITVTWPGHATAHAIARPDYGGILLGPNPAPRFDPSPLSRPARPPAPWPLGDQSPAPTPPPALAQAADPVFANSPGLYGILAATPGNILFERYSPHGAPHRPTPSWSMTKAITATHIARLIHMGWLSHLHDPAPAPLWTDRRAIHRLITLDHLMRMRSGLAFPTIDEHGRSGIGFENTFVYHSAEDAYDTAQRAIVAALPGAVFRYNNTGTNVLGAILRHQIEARGLPYYQTLYGLLADRIGMASYQQSADVAGNLIASGSGFATLRDYARFGLLYAQDGVWNGERLLPEGWPDYALTPSHTGNSYAACFRGNTDRFFPSLPPTAAWALGASDQRIIILRHPALVIAVTNETGHEMDLQALDRFCAAALSATP